MNQSDKDKKIAELYIARSEGKLIQAENSYGNWVDLSGDTLLLSSYRVKPQTVKEAAIDSIPHIAAHCEYFDGYVAGAVFGAKWQKEQGVDNCIKSEQENDQYERDCNE